MNEPLNFMGIIEQTLICSLIAKDIGKMYKYLIITPPPTPPSPPKNVRVHVFKYNLLHHIVFMIII